ncbi:MAG: translation initiation factor [Chitinophagales bacterium]
MSNKHAGDKRIVYSTDPNFKLNQSDHEQAETLPPQQQGLIIKLDAKKRAGKLVTLVEGFLGRKEDLEELAKKLKNFCGTGGSTKHGIIIIQGDQKEKIRVWLQKNGYKNPSMR